MERIDMTGKPCPIPVIEAKKALGKPGAVGVIVLVDNFVAVQNLEKMAKGNGYGFYYTQAGPNAYDVAISLDGKAPPAPEITPRDNVRCAPGGGFVVVIGRDTMGSGSEELGRILIKGFIYSLTELPTPPSHVFFLNSGAFLTSEGSNAVDDLKKLEEKGTKIFTCGTCVNYYGLQEKLAVGAVTNMYGIVEQLAAASNVVTI